MKTEDIDKKIGMPDVDEEWARFEQEVISKETKRRSALAWALGLSIAASVALFPIIYNIGKEQKEDAPLMAQTQPTQPQQMSEPVRVDVQANEKAKEVVANVSKPVIAQHKEKKLMSAEALATSSEDGIESPKIVLTLSSLPRETTMRLRGTGSGPNDKDRIDSTLILVNGEPLPDSLKQKIMGNDMDDIDTYMPRFFSQQGMLIDSAYVHKDSYYTEKYGGRAKYGLIEIKVVPDTFCDAYVRKHPKLMKKYQRVEGYVVDNNGKPLTEAYVHVERDFIGAPTDSTGHFVFWIPKKDVTLCAEQTGYRTVEFSPSDTCNSSLAQACDYAAIPSQR